MECGRATTFVPNVAPQWVFLGPPGVGKGTYSKLVAKHTRVPHISTGDLVREEMKRGSDLGRQFREITHGGHLLPDELILNLLNVRLADTHSGFILDGFPRTRAQAERLSRQTDIHLVINMSLREEALLQKCLGRRTCSKCNKDFNVAEVYVKAQNGAREIRMPPLMPPKEECLQYMIQRDDDREEIIKKRIEVYKTVATPVEEYYRSHGTLLDFEVVAGIAETWPELLRALRSHLPKGNARSMSH